MWGWQRGVRTTRYTYNISWGSYGMVMVPDEKVGCMVIRTGVLLMIVEVVVVFKGPSGIMMLTDRYLTNLHRYTEGGE